MVLGFKPQFVEKILNGTKKHTVRFDPHQRWRKGKKIHASTGVRTKLYNCFLQTDCVKVQRVFIDPLNMSVTLRNSPKDIALTFSQVLLFAQNDGFDTLEEFWDWFDKPFFGVVIFWTEVTYKHYFND